MSEEQCGWLRAFDGHFNISCPTGERANGDFRSTEDYKAKWEFKYCPYCARPIKIVEPLDKE